jgi:hypothetical protein
MYELHENEQYFFDSRTLLHLTNFLSAWENPCCICAPLLGQGLPRQDSTYVFSTSTSGSPPCVASGAST